MYLFSVQSLPRYYSLSLPKQIEQSFFSDAANQASIAIATIAAVALLAIAAMVAIVMMSTASSYTPKFILKRDSEGYYTLPQFEVPGFSNKGNYQAKELYIRAGDFVLDTANGILPFGWAIEG